MSLGVNSYMFTVTPYINESLGQTAFVTKFTPFIFTLFDIDVRFICAWVMLPAAKQLEVHVLSGQRTKKHSNSS